MRLTFKLLILASVTVAALSVVPSVLADASHVCAEGSYPTYKAEWYQQDVKEGLYASSGLGPGYRCPPETQAFALIQLLWLPIVLFIIATVSISVIIVMKKRKNKSRKIQP